MQATSDTERNEDVVFETGLENGSVTVDITLPIYTNDQNQSATNDERNKILMCHLAPGKTLGLSLARHIIEAHGATFEHITSSPKNTLIKLRFPLSEVSESPMQLLARAAS